SGGRSPPPDRDGDLRDHRRARARLADRSARALPAVRHEHDHDDRPRGRHRLFVVHRVPLPGGATSRLEKLDAIAATGATASRAVFFSGVTVVLALIGMLILPTTIFRALAGGAILVVIASLFA